MKRIRIRGKIVFLLLVFGLFPALGVFGTFLFFKDRFNDALNGPIENAARQVGSNIDISLNSLVGELKLLAAAPILRDDAVWYDRSPENEVALRMDKLVKNTTGLEVVVFAGQDGTLLISNHKNSDNEDLPFNQFLDNVSYASESWFKDVMDASHEDDVLNQLGSTISGLENREELRPMLGESVKMMRFVVPVFNDFGGRAGVVVGYVSTALMEPIARLAEIALEKNHISSAVIEVRDGAGEIISSSSVVSPLDWRDFKPASRGNAILNGVDFSAAVVASDGVFNFPGFGWRTGVVAQNEDIYAQVKATNNWMFIVLLCTGLLTVGAGLWIGLLAARPVAALTRTMEDVSNGLLDVTIPGKDRGDELGGMAHALETFRKNAYENIRLREEQEKAKEQAEVEKKQVMAQLAEHFESSVSSVVASVSGSAKSLQVHSGVLQKNSSKTIEQSGDMVRTMDGAMQNVQSVAGATEQLSCSITEISRQVNDALGVSAQAVVQSQQSDKTIQNMASAADKIGQVVQLISDIAEQTNMLALNATIEAARAGDAGKGFAVVASEVKNLANLTTKATQDISDQISEIQGISANVAGDVREIGETIKNINEISTAIAAAIEEQSSATQEINSNVQYASNGVQEVAKTLSDVRHSAEQSGETSKDVSQSSDALMRQFEELEGEVQSFLQQVRSV